MHSSTAQTLSSCSQVGFYQIAKLCNIPFVCAMETMLYSRHFSPPVLGSISLVMAGVGLVTISDVAINLTGLTVALISVVAAGTLMGLQHLNNPF